MPANAYDILETYIDTAAEEYSVHPDLIKSVAASESSFDPSKVSAKGAVGIMQLMPLIARQYGVTDPLDPIQNIRAGTRYLGDLLKKHGGNQELALAEYHGGPKNVKTGKVPLHSNNYVRKTMQNFADQGASLRRIYSKVRLEPGGVKVREPSESEKKFFKDNPDIPGMASEDHNVVMNPYKALDDTTRNAVIKNETVRAFMHKQGIEPSFTLTKAQQAAFSTINKGSSYGSEQDVRETVVGRILSGDPSAGTVTQDQQEFANRLKQEMEKDETTGSERLEPEKVRELVR